RSRSVLWSVVAVRPLIAVDSSGWRRDRRTVNPVRDLTPDLGGARISTGFVGFRSSPWIHAAVEQANTASAGSRWRQATRAVHVSTGAAIPVEILRSEEHTSELQSPYD